MTTENTYQTVSPYETRGLYVHDTEAPDAPQDRFGSPYRYQAYQEGWWQGGADTYEDAAALLFPHYGAGGYTLSYYPTDGDEQYPQIIGIELCAKCALDQWLDDPTTTYQVELNDSDRRYELGIYCDGGCLIDPQLCPECGDELDSDRHHLPLFQRGDETYVIHADCLAELVTKGEATKTGKLTYQVDRDAQWYGSKYHSYTANR